LGELREQIQRQQDELAALRQQQQQQQQQPAPMDTTTPADTATTQALQQMAELLRQSQDLNRQFMSHLASKPMTNGNQHQRAAHA
jgi:hypothetical protein